MLSGLSLGIIAYHMRRFRDAGLVGALDYAGFAPHAVLACLTAGASGWRNRLAAIYGAGERQSPPRSPLTRVNYPVESAPNFPGSSEVIGALIRAVRGNGTSIREACGQPRRAPA